MILAYITRGIGPIRQALDALAAANLYGWRFKLIDGEELVDAKNAAADYALEWEDDLLMVEDDMDVPAVIWQAVNEPVPADVIVIAETNCRNGATNIYRTPSGKFLYTGSCFVKVPLDILSKLSIPIYQAYSFGRSSDGEELFPKGPNETGRGSDTYFWHHALALNPTPEVRIIGKVGHLKHPMNTDWNHKDPYKAETF